MAKNKTTEDQVLDAIAAEIRELDVKCEELKARCLALEKAYVPEQAKIEATRAQGITVPE